MLVCHCPTSSRATLTCRCEPAFTHARDFLTHSAQREFAVKHSESTADMSTLDMARRIGIAVSGRKPRGRDCCTTMSEIVTKMLVDGTAAAAALPGPRVVMCGYACAGVHVCARTYV